MPQWGARHWITGRAVFVTGATGFIGRHLCRALRHHGARVTATSRSGAVVIGVRTLPGVDLIRDDLVSIMRGDIPEVIFHCAGLTRGSAQALETGNITTAQRLLDAAAALPRPLRIVVLSSAAIWEPMREGQAMIGESHPFGPVGPYGAAKLRMTELALQSGLDVAVACPFNVIGPGQPVWQMPQVLWKELRANPARIELRDPSVIRDWIDVRDVAEALILLANPQATDGIYNVCTGTGRSIAEVVAALCRIGGLNPNILGPKQAPISLNGRSIGNPGKIFAATGWKAHVPLDSSLFDMIYF